MDGPDASVRIDDVDVTLLESALDRRVDAGDGTVRVDAADVSRLVGALEDGDEGVRRAAATALGAVGEQSPGLLDGPGPVLELARALRDDAPGVRRATLTALARIGRPLPLDPDAPGGRPPAGDRSPASDLEAPDAPDRITDPVRVLEAADVPVREVADRMVDAPDDGGADDLLAYLEDDRAVVRAAAKEGIEELANRTPEAFADADTVDRSLVLRAEGSPAVREAATFALGAAVVVGREPALALGGVLDALDDPDGGVRETAAMLVGRLGTAAPDALAGTGAVARLVAALDDESPPVRREAAEGLGRIGSERPGLLARTDAIDRLHAAREGDGRDQQAAATGALEALRRDSPELFEDDG